MGDIDMTSLLINVVVAFVFFILGLVSHTHASNRLARRTGQLSEARLRAMFATVELHKGQTDVVYVLPIAPEEDKHIVNLPIVVHNCGDAPADDVLLTITSPKPGGGTDNLQPDHLGFVPGLEYKLDSVGELLRSSTYVPFLSPADGASVVHPMEAVDTKRLGQVSATTADGVSGAVKYELDFRWRVGLDIRDKNGAVRVQDLRIEVIRSEEGQEVTAVINDLHQALLDHVTLEDKQRESLARWARMRYSWSMRNSASRQRALSPEVVVVVPHFEKAYDSGDGSLFIEKPEESQFGTIHRRKGEWIFRQHLDPPLADP